MKFFFSFFLLIPIYSNAALINVLYESNLKDAKIVKNIFLKRYEIPAQLVVIKKGSCLERVDERFMNICITKKGELIQLSSNINFIRKSLNTFHTP